jgi:hypothetical protein
VQMQGEETRSGAALVHTYGLGIGDRLGEEQA